MCQGQQSSIYIPDQSKYFVNLIVLPLSLKMGKLILWVEKIYQKLEESLGNWKLIKNSSLDLKALLV